jgi:hypothetical protein
MIIDPVGVDAGQGRQVMKRIILLVCTAALALSVTTGPAAAAPTQAKNYQTYDLACDGLGNITIEVVNRGHWGAAKVQGTQLTLIQSWATLTVTPEGSDTVVYEEAHAKGNDDIDDICRRSWTQEVVEGDPDAPPGFPAGTYLLQAETGVKHVGR